MLLFSLWQKFLSRFGLWKNIELKENTFIARVLKSNELEKAYRFRYRVFCEELRWFPPNNSKKENDHYDKFSVHFGVFSKKEELIGYSRIIPPERNFMLEKEFKDLLDNHTIRKERDTIEVSRVAINKTSNFADSIDGVNIISALLYKLMYKWSKKNRIRYWYMAIEPHYLKSLQELFSCKQIGKIKFYQPEIPTAAALLDLKETELFLHKKNKKLYNWFQK